MAHPATPLARRAVLGGLVSLGAAGAVGATAWPAAAAPLVVGGHVRPGYVLAGGSSRLGRPSYREVKTRIEHHDTYGQRFRRGTVWYGSGVSKVDRPSARVRLDTAPNFRPVLGVRDVWRSDDLDGCSPLEERIVHDLGIATVVAMNHGSDPSISGVQNLRYRVGNAGSHLDFYRGYVTLPASRLAIGQVLTAVATSSRPVLVHCSAGKDRTGWVADLLQALLLLPQRQRDADYLATTTYSADHVDLAWLQAARDQLTHDYGAIEAYLCAGCGLSLDTLAALRERIAVR